MRRIQRRLKWIGLVAAICLVGFTARSQVGSGVTQGGIPITTQIRVGPSYRIWNADNSIRTQPQGDPLGGAGTTDSSLVKDADAVQDKIFRTLSEGWLRTPKIGGTQGSLHTTAPLFKNANFSLLTWEDKPEDAELKIGRLYLDLLAISGTVLYSDNVFQVEKGTDGEAFAIMTLRGAIIFQFSETMRLAAGGAFGWLPFTNEIGFQDPVAAYSADVAPAFTTRFNYDIPFGKNSTLFIFDSFDIASSGIGGGETFDLLNRDVSDLEDTEGNHGFRFFQSTDRQRRTTKQNFTYFNTVGVSFTSLLPTVTRLTTGYTHNNVWFDDAVDGQPSSFDTIGINFASERENMRFKPSLGYTATHINNKFGFDQSLSIGVRGPITDRMEFLGRWGLTWFGDRNDKSLLWSFGIAHQPRESTRYQLTWDRTTAFPAAEFATSIRFQIQQILSPVLTVDAVYAQTDFEPLDNPNTFFGSKLDVAAGNLNIVLGDRVTCQMGYAWTHDIQRGPAPRPAIDTHTVKMDLVVRHTTITDSRIGYRFNRRESNRLLDSFDENVVFYTLTRQFP